MVRFLALLAALLLGAAPLAWAQDLTVTMFRLSDAAPIGVVQIREVPGFGLLFAPNLSGLPPGFHGFHLHLFPDCSTREKDGVMVPGLGAGNHFDPKDTGRHEGPYGKGHLGDLPTLWVEADGTAVRPVLAQRPTLADVHGYALMIHEGGDHYSDEPEPLGGGGARIACGVVP